MAPPPTYVVSPTISLVVRIATIVCLVVSIAILTTSTGTAYLSRYTYADVKFKDFKAFRYLCGVSVLGLAYTIVQAAFTASRLVTGNRVGGDTLIYLDFYGDKVASYLLATGGAAAFGMTQDINELADAMGIDHFINMTNIAAAFCLLACACTVVSSIFSSFSLPKRPSSV